MAFSLPAVIEKQKQWVTLWASNHWNLVKLELIDTIDQNCTKMVSNWIEIHGRDNHLLEEKCRHFSKRIGEFTHQLLVENEDMRAKLIDDTEALYEEYYRMHKDLGMNTEELGFADTDPLEKIYNWLKIKVAQLKEEVTERLKLAQDLMAKQLHLCEILKEDPIPPTPSTPSVDYLRDLTDNVQALEIRKKKFDEEMTASRQRVAEILTRLELSAEHPIERFCVDGSYSFLPYNVETLRSIEDHTEKLLHEEKDMKQEADQLRETLGTLWSRINARHAEREKILSGLQGYTKKDITMLKMELKRCEEIKQKNLKFYIANIKAELADWWNCCLLSPQEKEKFLPFKETHASDEILMLIELELEKVKSFYNKYKPIYELLERRKECWDRLLHLEAASKDSRRLLSRDGNRGGALLKEEQERKKVQKELPKVEELLKKKLTQFENEEGREFTVYGESVRSIMEREHNEFRTKKEQPKKAVGSGTVGSCAKKRKLTDAQPPQVTRYRTPMNKPDRNFATSSTSSRKELQAGSVSLSNASTSSSYSLFQEHLEGKNETQKTPCCSTFTPSNILKPHNSQLPSHSSPKTPRITPYYKTRSNTTRKTPQSRPPFKIGGTTSSSKIPTLTLPIKSPRVTPQLKTPRRKLPIII